MVAVLVASILVVTASTFLVGVFQNYSRNTRYVEMQRDGAATFQLMGKHLRQASSSRVTASNNVLRIVGTNNVTRSFYRSAGNLFFDPNTAVAGDEMRMVYDRVHAFTVSNDTRAVYVTLHLAEGGEESVLQSQFTFRN